MRRLVPILGLLLVVLQLAAQAPDWCNAASRKMHYPPEIWYTGYVEGEQQSGEILEKAMSRLKDAARVELVSTIRTSVEQTIQERTSSDLQQSTTYFEEDIRDTYVSDTRISSSIRDIPGLKIEAYHNPNTKQIAAFAYLKRTTLINQLTRRIALELGKAESTLSQAETYINNGQKEQAQALLEKIFKQFETVEEAQSLLAIVDDEADAESLQIEQLHNMKKIFSNLSAQIQNATKIYLYCDANLFDTKDAMLVGKIRGELSQLGVSFVTEAEQSNWAIYVEVSTREGKKNDYNGESVYYAYVDAQIRIIKTATGQHIYENIITEKDGHAEGYSQAALLAYRHITPRISEIIKQNIQQ
jgi:hypothetical protein